MKQNILRKLMLIAVLLTGVNAFAHDFEVYGIFYNITSDSDLTVEVTYSSSYKYTGSVVIPETVTYNNQRFKVTFNEECIRSNSKVSLEFADSLGNPFKGLSFIVNNKKSIVFRSPKQPKTTRNNQT